MMSWSRRVSRSVRSLPSVATLPALASAQTQADDVAERLAKLEGAAGD